ncbi:MAG: sulfotransferase domain-containing protein [Candidatus Binatia bacterium]
MSDRRLAYFGHHKCGTRWLYAIVRQVCAELGLRQEEVHNSAMADGDLGAFMRRRNLDFVAYTNAEYAYVPNLGRFRGFHVIRDPRDVVVSAYFSHRYSHPTREFPGLGEHRERLAGLPKEEGLLAEIEYSDFVLRSMYEWNYDNPDVLELRIEDVTANPYQRALEVFRFLGLVEDERFGVLARARHLAVTAGRSIASLGRGVVRSPFSLKALPAERLLGIVYENDFTRKSGGRKPGEEDVTSHYRKGVAGDWMNHFRPEHVAMFKKKYDDVLVKLGYENDDRW